MELQGYVTLKKDADCSRAMGEQALWKNKDVRVMEFNPEGDVLVISADGEHMGMFEKKDYYRSFKCGEAMGILTPPGLDMMGQMMYCTKVQNRKGGYAPILRSMLIQASLMKGEFQDQFLFTYSTEKTEA